MNSIIAFCILTIPIWVLSVQHGDRVLGGINVDIIDHEYMASLVVQRHMSRRESSEMILFCSAVIVRPYAVLTTATCITEAISKFRKAVIRSNTNNWHTSIYPYNDHRITGFTKHPNWKYTDYDVAVVQVDPPFDGEFEKPIEILDKFPATGTYLESYGWGRVDLFGDDPHIFRYSFELKGIGSRVMEPKECVNKVMNVRVKEVTKLLCSLEAEIGGCDGDQGGPFVSNGKLAGILSHPGCGKEISIHVSLVRTFPWLQRRLKSRGKARQSNAKKP